MADDARALLRSLGPFPADLPAFDPESAPAEPVGLFIDWLREAADASVLAPHAAVLSTGDAAGRVSARVLILKDVDADGWRIATPSTGAAGTAMREHPHAALTFFWPAVGRQVKVTGRVVEATREASAADFRARPPAARVAGLVHRPGEPLADDAAYAAARMEAEARLAADPGTVADDWRVWTIAPDTVEFWQASHDRAHIRLEYRRGDAGAWSRRRLWP